MPQLTISSNIKKLAISALHPLDLGKLDLETLSIYGYGNFDLKRLSHFRKLREMNLLRKEGMGEDIAISIIAVQYCCNLFNYQQNPNLTKFTLRNPKMSIKIVDYILENTPLDTFEIIGKMRR